MLAKGYVYFSNAMPTSGIKHKQSILLSQWYADFGECDIGIVRVLYQMYTYRVIKMCYTSDIMYCFIIIVPVPSVNITGVPTSPLSTGTSLFLTCTFELHSTIDSPVTLNSIWRRAGVVLNSDSRVNISAISAISSSVYRTELSISPLINTMDSGQYSCQSVFTSDEYVQYADGSQQVLVGIAGNVATTRHYFIDYN